MSLTNLAEWMAKCNTWSEMKRLIDYETLKAFLFGINRCTEHTTLMMRGIATQLKSQKGTTHMTFLIF